MKTTNEDHEVSFEEMCATYEVMDQQEYTQFMAEADPQEGSSNE
ncbi:hypothetical protein [Streptomyces sp. NPDC004589]